MSRPITAHRWQFLVPLMGLVLCACNPFKAEVPQIKEGITDYNASKWADAEKKFEAANNAAPSSEGHFDAASSLYKQQKFDDADEQMRRVLTTKDDGLRERTYFNLGNIDAKAGHLDKAKEDFRRALQLRPDDMDARYNLEWAMREEERQKQEQEKQKNGQQKPDDKKNGSDQQAKNDKDKQDQQNKDGSKKDDKQDQQQQQAQKDQGSKQSDQQGQNQQEQAQNGQDQQKSGSDKSQQQDQQKQDQQQASADQQKDAQQQQAQQGQQQQAQQGQQQNGQAAQLAQNGNSSQDLKSQTQSTAAVLDALQAGEKNMQMWRFQKHQNVARSPVDKDW